MKLEGDNIIERVAHAIATDDGRPERDSASIKERYETATPAERELLDGVFVLLCGWRLSTIIKGEVV